jgi:hypothetical protein
MGTTILRVMVTLVDPVNPPSRKAPLVWALAAAIPWALLSAAQVVWVVLDARLGWLHATAAATPAGVKGYRVLDVPAELAWSIAATVSPWVAENDRAHS